MKRAFLVLGPESSATRLLTKILIAGGCVGDAGHDQLWDKTRPTDDVIVWRRSVPHRGHHLELPGLLEWLERYHIHIIIPVRDYACIEGSQMKTFGRVIDPHTTYQEILWQVVGNQIPFTLVSYESLILDPVGVQRNLWEEWRLGIGEPVAVYDGNLKYKA